MSNVTKLPVNGIEPSQVAALQQRADSIIKGIDGFTNAVTGLGYSPDKSIYTRFSRQGGLDEATLEALYEDHDLAANIVEELVKDALRSGYSLNWEGATEDERKQAHDFGEGVYHVTEETEQARIWSRLFGGAGIFMGIEGNLLSMAMEGAPVSFLRAIPSPRLEVDLYYADITQQNYSQANVYKHTQLKLNEDQELFEPFVFIHESRVVPFFGVRTTDRQRVQYNKGWGKSVLHRVYDVLKKFDTSFDSTLATLEEMSVPVYKVKALLDLLASENGELLAKRFELINTAKGAYNAVILDMEEVFERVEASLSEANGVVELAMYRVSAAAEKPAIKLFGRSPAGQNATGASDLENWNQKVRSEQMLKLAPAMVRTYRYLLAQPSSPVAVTPEQLDTLTIEFPPVETLSVQEQANLYQQIATADTQYEQMGAATAAEIAETRAATSHLFPKVDLDHLRELDKVRKEKLINPPDPMEFAPPEGGDDDGGEPGPESEDRKDFAEALAALIEGEDVEIVY